MMNPQFVQRMADTHKGSQVPCTSHKRSGTMNPSQRGQEVGNVGAFGSLLRFIFAEILSQIGGGAFKNEILSCKKDFNPAVRKIEKL